MDRRSARTRRALHEALISLILRRGYDDITIQEIIDEADVGRATFYAHYRGKEDLLRGGFETLRVELRAARRAGSPTAGETHGGPLAFSLAMFEHACAYRGVYKAMIGGRGGAVAIHEIRRVLTELVREELPALRRDACVSQELAVEFVVGTFLNVLAWCLESRPELTPPEVDAMFQSLVTGGIGSSMRAAV